MFQDLVELQSFVVSYNILVEHFINLNPQMILLTGQSFSPLPLMTGNQDVPGRGHTISLNDSEPGSSSFPLDSPPQYMPDSPPEYSVLPGSAGMTFYYYSCN